MYRIAGGFALRMALVGFSLMLGGRAEGHIQLDEPTRRQADVSGPSLAQKNGPCGLNQRSSNVTVFQPGESITVRWIETINHPGHYRIAFDPDGQDSFQEPICLTNCENLANPTFDFYDAPEILVDNIPDDPSRAYEVQITLPNIECENCTLQLIQVMYDKPPYTLPPNSNDNYYQCADLVLRSGVQPAPDAGPPDGAPGTDAMVGGPADAAPDLGPGFAPDAAPISPPDAGVGATGTDGGSGGGTLSSLLINGGCRTTGGLSDWPSWGLWIGLALWIRRGRPRDA